MPLGNNPIGNPQPLNPPAPVPQSTGAGAGGGVNFKWLIGTVALWFMLIGLARVLPAFSVMMGALIALAASYLYLPKALAEMKGFYSGS